MLKLFSTCNSSRFVVRFWWWGLRGRLFGLGRVYVYVVWFVFFF